MDVKNCARYILHVYQKVLWNWCKFFNIEYRKRRLSWSRNTCMAVGSGFLYAHMSCVWWRLYHHLGFSLLWTLYIHVEFDPGVTDILTSFCLVFFLTQEEGLVMHEILRELESQCLCEISAMLSGEISGSELGDLFFDSVDTEIKFYQWGGGRPSGTLFDYLECVPVWTYNFKNVWSLEDTSDNHAWFGFVPWERDR